LHIYLICMYPQVEVYRDRIDSLSRRVEDFTRSVERPASLEDVRALAERQKELADIVARRTRERDQLIEAGQVRPRNYQHASLPSLACLPFSIISVLRLCYASF
jgi:hypothetical protein